MLYYGCAMVPLGACFDQSNHFPIIYSVGGLVAYTPAHHLMLLPCLLLYLSKGVGVLGQ